MLMKKKLTPERKDDSANDKTRKSRPFSTYSTKTTERKFFFGNEKFEDILKEMDGVEKEKIIMKTEAQEHLLHN